jgi:hypothetical protein
MPDLRRQIRPVAPEIERQARSKFGRTRLASSSEVASSNFNF